LAPLAYLSPRVIQAIAEGRAPADLTVTQLVRNLPLTWAEQEEKLGLG
jgi:site-specific DNA recombinase